MSTADSTPDGIPADADDTGAPPHSRRSPRAAAGRHARRLVSAYSGEHGIYGIVLVTALIAGEIDADTDWDVILFVFGTVCVFWLAHIYAAVVASRGKRPAPPLGVGIRDGIRHSAGMVVAMLVPVAILGLGTLEVLDEWTAYFLALLSGVVLLGIIGYANARRNGSSWPWRVLGVVTTTFLGVIVILLSIAVH
jgi:positive regulator of sigma E activity